MRPAWELDSGEFLLISEFLPLGPGLVPFALDWGGNCLCFDAAGAVYFLALDGRHAERSVAENLQHTTRWVAASFDAFLSGLQADPDAS